MQLGLWVVLMGSSAWPLCGADGAAGVDLDAQAAVALAESIPLLTLNLNRVYYSTGQQSLGLIRAPKRSVHQPLVLWQRQPIEPAGLQSMILEPDRLPFTLHLTSDRDGELRLLAWNPAAEEWLELAPAPVRAGVPCSLAPLPAHAKLRLKFTPRDGPATVSAWAVPQ